VVFVIHCNAQTITHFIFTSDVHFGLEKKNFRGKINVSASEVNIAMVDAMNMISQTILPNDKGIAANNKVKSVAAVIITGDIANRQEKEIQPATQSWKEFEACYLKRLSVQNSNGNKAPLYLVAGNHDISNAIGHYKMMKPEKDAASYIGIYNLMMQPSVPKTNQSFNYETDKVHYSKDIAGIHLLFINLWPDSAERKWMEKDLEQVATTTPVLIFTHSYPDVEAKFFINPNGNHSINEKDGFENLLSEAFKDGHSSESPAIIEQKELEIFIRKHSNIKAYFHGHSNFNEFYTWKGVDGTIALPCFRADSPMKGKYSSKDESKLSFQLISIDTDNKLLTVRECLWNSYLTTNGITWGNVVTISLQ